MRTSRGVIEVTSGSDLFLNISEVAKTNLGVARPLSLSWFELAARLLNTTRAPEKNIGGYVGSRFNSKSRSKKSVIDAQIISLDFDREVDFSDVWGAFRLLEFTGLIYTTYSHTPENNRFRIVVPLSRPVNATEYPIIAHEVVLRLGSPNIDEGSYQAERLFYWPATPEGGEFISDYSEGDILNPDTILTDTQSTTPQTKDRPVEPKDPTQKKGLIGAFCRVYLIPEAISTFLSNKYEQCEDRKGNYYTYLPGSTSGGMFVYPSGLHAYSHHSTDPANTGHAVNAFDLVRLHRFGYLDNKTKADTPLTKRPSFKAMRELVLTDEAVQKEIQKEQRGKATSDYDEVEAYINIGCQKVISELLKQIEWVNFRNEAELDEDAKITRKTYVTIAIEQIDKAARSNNWGLCTQNGFIYVYNGAYWQSIDAEDFKQFLVKAAIKMSVPVLEAKYYQFKDEMYKQFLSASHLAAPDADGRVLINLLNGTFEVSTDGIALREPQRENFIKYQLPFEYDPDAKCPTFDSYLHQVLPDVDCRMVLAEYMGYIFTRDLKLEKALMLYGGGANGKSVFFDVVRALLGNENICSYPLSDITRQESWQRAELSNKLLNYNSEISGELKNDIFKQLISGEPVSAQRKYKDPFIMTGYAKLMFNGNVLPKAAELTNAYFRRFITIPFNVTIPEDKQDPELAKKIINTELSGVFNWVLDGLYRLLENKKFTQSDVIKNQIDTFKKESDSVAMFIEDEGYTPSVNDFIPLKEIYDSYRSYCYDSGYRAVSNKTASERLKKLGFESERKSSGYVIYAKK